MTHKDNKDSLKTNLIGNSTTFCYNASFVIGYDGFVMML
jgi:hypothetical protein